MTIKGEMVRMLQERGMFRNQAEEVIALVIADPTSESMAKRWNDNVSGYPAALLRVLWLSVQSYAVIWIDANLPQAWFRPMFAEEAGIGKVAK